MSCINCKNCDWSSTRMPCEVCRLIDGDATPKPACHCKTCGAYICQDHWNDAPARIHAAMISAYQESTAAVARTAEAVVEIAEKIIPALKRKRIKSDKKQNNNENTQ